MKLLRHLALSLLLAVAALAADIKVGSLDAYLSFDPALNHRGKVDDANRMALWQPIAKRRSSGK